MTAAKKIISALLVLAAAVGAGLALATFLPQNRQPVAQPPKFLRIPPYTAAACRGTKMPLGIQHRNIFGISITAALVWGRTAACRCWENTAGNECMMQVRYTPCPMAPYC